MFDGKRIVPQFVDEAERFARLHRSRLIFRFLKYFLQCNESELDFVIKKIYTRSIQQNTYLLKVPPARACLELMFLPFYCLATKSFIWRREKVVDYNVETIDKGYFKRWFAELYDNLEGSKRLTPRGQESFARGEVTENIDSSVRGRDLIGLFIVAPVLIIPLVVFAERYNVPILAAFTRSLYHFVKFNGYFARYPCRNFVTYSDETNHPCRYIAFRHHCRGQLVVVQNGERSCHPQLAYGMVDVYFVFGSAYADILRDIKVSVKSFHPVGALCLNEHVKAIAEGIEQAKELEHDIMFIDQSVRPYNGFSEKSADSIDAILRNLKRYKEMNPSTRLAYQLRNYCSDLTQKEIVVQHVRDLFQGGITILDNVGNGETYRNIFLANLVVTFESTVGFEAMRLGRKVLFVNYSGDPSETLCPDERFQLVDDSADYERFELRVQTLLSLGSDGIPQVALDRHFAFDGRVQQRVAQILNAYHASDITMESTPQCISHAGEMSRA